MLEGLIEPDRKLAAAANGDRVGEAQLKVRVGACAGAGGEGKRSREARKLQDWGWRRG